MLTSRGFLVFYFTFRSTIHFQLIVVKGIRSLSRLFFHVDVQLFQYHLLWRPCFLHSIAFAPVSEEDPLHLCGSILGSWVGESWSLCTAFPSPRVDWDPGMALPRCLFPWSSRKGPVAVSPIATSIKEYLLNCSPQKYQRSHFVW